jgi:alpha-tubulin suppressor-like RCC1 family protein
MKKRLLAYGILGTLGLACGGDPAPMEPAPIVAQVEVTPGTDTLSALGQTRQFGAVARDAAGRAIAGKTFSWSSSAPGVAAVDPATGLVTAVANGDATIRAVVDGVTGQAALAVVQQVATVAVTPATASLTAVGATQQFGAEARDATSNVVVGVTFIWLSSDHNVATVSTNGLVTATGPGSATITAAGRGIPGNATLGVAQTATQLAFSVPPTNAAAGGAISPAVQVEIRDANGAVVTTARDPITLAIGSNPAGGTLAGTKIVNAAGGIATFSGLAIDKAGAGYTLVAAAGALNPATSAGFTVSSGVAARLAFAVQPTDATAGEAISPAVTVAVQDAFGNPVSGATGTVTMAIGTNPGGGTLVGSTAVGAVGGLATFGGISVQKSGTGYTLVASSSGLASATGAPFNIAAGPPAHLAFIAQPPSQVAVPITIAPPVRVAVQDAFGNTVSDATASITLALGTGPADATLLGASTVSAASGVAAFTDLRVDRRGQGYSLFATAGAFATLSAPFNAILFFGSVDAGYGHTCGVGAGECWGLNAGGQLGDGTATNRSRAVAAAPSGTLFTSVSAGTSHSCGIATDSAAYCWGFNVSGQLGDGTSTSRSTAIVVSGGLAFRAVSAGNAHTCGITTTGAAYCWGSDDFGQLGDGSGPPGTTTSPVAVLGALGFRSVSAGDKHTCGVTTANVAYCWGFNAGGQLGDSTTSNSFAPVAVAAPPGVGFTSVSAGFGHTCAVSTAGPAYCWGINSFGQLGDGTTTSSSTPVLVAAPGGATFTAVSAAGFNGYTCGVVTGGAIYCWGSNGSGQLGDGTTADHWTPTLMAAPAGVAFTSVSAGEAHACAAAIGGALYCWGSNEFGQLGTGTTAASLVPVRVLP